eukprot:TRINITY_DN870_c0_g1_i8.p1 TRINITY_DN870_c0_g1~~TRINITY_DN870_c0_g1_i8.p1  ORF type:complete len:933 (+),score=197.55 TRINITY_DN870_c0_g1_i8:99-2897(+)
MGNQQFVSLTSMFVNPNHLSPLVGAKSGCDTQNIPALDPSIMQSEYNVGKETVTFFNTSFGPFSAQSPMKPVGSVLTIPRGSGAFSINIGASPAAMKMQGSQVGSQGASIVDTDGNKSRIPPRVPDVLLKGARLAIQPAGAKSQKQSISGISESVIQQAPKLESITLSKIEHTEKFGEVLEEPKVSVSSTALSGPMTGISQAVSLDSHTELAFNATDPIQEVLPQSNSQAKVEEEVAPSAAIAIAPASTPAPNDAPQNTSIQNTSVQVMSVPTVPSTMPVKSSPNLKSTTILRHSSHFQRSGNERRDSSLGRETFFGRISGSVSSKNFWAKPTIPTVDKNTQQRSVQRLADAADERREAHSALCEYYSSVQMSKCSFQPKVRTNSKRRSVEGFLKDQRTFVDVVEEKKRQLAQVAELERSTHETFKPKISATSQLLVEKTVRANSVSYQTPRRGQLYTSQRGRMNKEASRIATEEQLFFTPKINDRSKRLQREDSVESILFSDARRRQEKRESKVAPQTSTGPTTLSETSQKALMNRFIREFDIAITEVPETSLNIESIIRILKKLDFLTHSFDVNREDSSPFFTQESTLLNDLWDALGGPMFGRITKYNLSVFLLAVLGLKADVSRESDYPGEVGVEECMRPSIQVGMFTESGHLRLSATDIETIHSTFDLFFVNRLTAAREEQVKNEESVFRPAVSKNTSNLAKEHRERILQQISSVVSEEDLARLRSDKAEQLYLEHAIKQHAFKQKANQMIASRTRECTFKPQINTPSRGTPAQKRQSSISRTQQLHAMAKPTVDRFDKDADQIEYERSCDECTFAPYVPKKSKVRQGSIGSVKDVDKAVERLRRAREEKEKVAALREKGTTNACGDRGNLFVDVNIGGGKVERLMLSKNDSAFAVARSFARRHNLPAETEERPVSYTHLTLPTIYSV